MSRAEQMERFLETAQALGCDPSEDLFGEIVRAIALARPGPPPTAPAAESTKHARPRRVSAEGARPVKDAKSTKRNAESTNDAGPRGATARHTTTRGVTIKSATTEARRNPKGSAKSKADETSTKIRAAKGLEGDKEAIGSEAGARRRKGQGADDRAGENRAPEKPLAFEKIICLRGFCPLQKWAFALSMLSWFAGGIIASFAQFRSLESRRRPYHPHR